MGMWQLLRVMLYYLTEKDIEIGVPCLHVLTAALVIRTRTQRQLHVHQ